MPTEYEETDQFRGARIHLSDLTGLEVRDCEVSDLKVVDCYGGTVRLSGDLERVVVNDVDVADYVEGELDRQHPARALARDASTPDEYRSVWDTIEALWAETFDRVRRLPDEAVQTRVDGEWSFVETQRHLLFASDAWLGNAVLEEGSPYHPLGFPAGGTPPADAARLGLTLAKTPTLAEVLGPRRDRMATMRRTVERLDGTELDRVCGRKPADSYPDRTYVVRSCLKVILKEEAEHHRYAVRDLALLESAS